MLPFGLSVVTALASTVFGIILLWVMTQWLKADEAALVGQQQLRDGVERLQRLAFEQIRLQTKALQRTSEPPTGAR